MSWSRPRPLSHPPALEEAPEKRPPASLPTVMVFRVDINSVKIPAVACDPCQLCGLWQALPLSDLSPSFHERKWSQL